MKFQTCRNFQQRNEQFYLKNIAITFFVKILDNAEEMLVILSEKRNFHAFKNIINSQKG